MMLRKLRRMLFVHKPVFAFTCSSTGFSLMHSIFTFYYVKIFLERYRITPGWFQAAQSMYLVWNAINDPLFAYVQDSVKFKFLKTRRHAILYSAPFFALTFLLPWFPWEPEGQGTWITGIHLVVALALYDSVFTFAGLACCCLFTELSSQHDDRVKLLRISSVGGILGSSIGVYACEATSNNLKNYSHFQITCVIVAVCGWLLLTYAGLHAHTEFDLKSEKSEKERLTDGIEDSSTEESLCETQINLSESCDRNPHSRVSNYSMWRLTWHVLSNKNFIAFVTVNFFQGIHRTWMSNFSVILTENLIPPAAIHPHVRSIFHGLLNSIPAILVICAGSIVSRFGSHKLIMWNFYVKIVNSCFLFICGYNNPWILMICMLIDNGYTGAAYSLFNMCLSDIADNDMDIYKRKHPVTSMIYGTNALIIKPADSLSPMLIAYILNSYGYRQLTQSSTPLSADQFTQLKGVMFSILCFLPIIVAIIQIIAWSQYALRETHQSKTVNIEEEES